MTRRWWAAALAGLVVLSGCTTIPSSSSPQVVRTLGRSGAGSPQPSITPEAGEGAREVVKKFIAAAVQFPGASHSSSRQFLTTAAARKWQDNTAVILDNQFTGVSVDVGDRATVVVSGLRTGQLDSAGVYTPTLKNLGKGDLETFTYRLVKIADHWRIDQLPPGVLVEQPAFNNLFTPASTTLYFLNSAGADSSQITLVPDVRYTPLTGQALASWLLVQLLAGPRPELAQAVFSEVPEQVNKLTVQLGDPITIEMPGANQLDEAGRNGLAAQLAYTFSSFEYTGAQLTITDGGRPVQIPATHATTFSYQNDFNVISPANASTANAYYLRGGAVIDASHDQPVPGMLGQPGQLDSVAMLDNGSGVLQAAGVSQNSLLVGTEQELTKVALPAGALSRPEWRPHTSEVWVGVGSKIYRVTPDKAARPVSVTSTVGGGQTGQVLALRFSSDGVRMAAVVRAPDGTSAAWVGSVTPGTDVRIDSFEPVTPVQLAVSDVAWADDLKLPWANDTRLLVIGTAAPGSSAANAGVAQVWRLGSDGAQLSPISNSGLPGPPTAIAERDSQPMLVSASGFIWAYSIQDTQGWVAYPAIKTANQGTNPIFAQ
jgi:hypothetical protein